MGNYAFFNLKKVSFKDSNLLEVEFTEADLSGVTFDNCNLQRAIFDQSKLEKTNFKSAFNFSINPSNNYIRKAKFSLQGLKGLLEQYDLEID